ncbi:hypothetical protein [Rhizobium sp. AAP43]|uniref:hypothetical protein n=1 Tax=Rhizobium sp. AAP43 TaxID=1523420 RepID=UPI0006B8BBC2|nr:hypothetical protein [Rhizobium sp. AAP43]KPF47094.1 hypothetical protein IP76_02010 [Rhizobium sp. AAP43]
MADITLWLPERDTVTHQALGKAAEECGELTQILARCIIQGIEGRDPKTGQPNRERLAEELADVDAAISWLFELLDLDIETHNARSDRKLTGFREWADMIKGSPAE